MNDSTKLHEKYPDKFQREPLVNLLVSIGAEVSGSEVRGGFRKEANASGSIFQGDGGVWLFKDHIPGGVVGDVYRLRDLAGQPGGYEDLKRKGGGSQGGGGSQAARARLKAQAIQQGQRSNRGPGKLTATYPYTDASGSLLFEKQRYESTDPTTKTRTKTFRQRRPDPEKPGGWISNRRGIEPVLYRLPEVIAAPLDKTVFIVEGEKDVEALRGEGAGLVATTNPDGAGKWAQVAESAREVLKGRPVCIIPDNDQAGRDHAADVARSLWGSAASIKICELPGLPEKGDFSDWMAAGRAVEEFMRAVEQTPPLSEKPAAPAGTIAAGTAGKPAAAGAKKKAARSRGPRPPQTHTLLQIVKEKVRVFADAQGRTFAAFPGWRPAEGGGKPAAAHVEVQPVDGVAFNFFLQREYMARDPNGEMSLPGPSALKSVVENLRGAALQMPREEVALRFAWASGACCIRGGNSNSKGEEKTALPTLFVDIGDARRRYVEVRAEGVRVVDRAVSAGPDFRAEWLRLIEGGGPRFVRSDGMQALPVSGLSTGGKSKEPRSRFAWVKRLRPLINVGSDADFALLLGWLVTAMNPAIPRPVLFLHGEMGSSKSTSAEMLTRLIDPKGAVRLSMPTGPNAERDFFIHAEHNATLFYDNISFISGPVSDILCRLATGGALSIRELYSDRNMITMESRRPVILTGIDQGAIRRGDLLDRTLFIELKPIPDRERRAEREVMAEFEALRADAFAGLLAACSVAIRRAPDIQARGDLALHRMADFVLWAVAALPGLGIDEGAFLTALDLNRAGAVSSNIENDLVASALLKLLDSWRGEWAGSMQQLHRDLAGVLAGGGDEDEGGGDGFNDDGGHGGGRFRGPDPLRSRDWPATPAVLGSHIKRFSPILRRVGVEVESRRRRAGMLVTIRRVRDEGANGSMDSSMDGGSMDSGSMFPAVFDGQRGNTPEFPSVPVPVPVPGVAAGLGADFMTGEI